MSVRCTMNGIKSPIYCLDTKKQWPKQQVRGVALFKFFGIYFFVHLAGETVQNRRYTLRAKRKPLR